MIYNKKRNNCKKSKNNYKAKCKYWWNNLAKSVIQLEI